MTFLLPNYYVNRENLNAVMVTLTPNCGGGSGDLAHFEIFKRSKMLKFRKEKVGKQNHPTIKVEKVQN